jgi:hypothetical protein
MISAGVGPTTGAGEGAAGDMLSGTAFVGTAGVVDGDGEPETSDFASLTAFWTSSQPEKAIGKKDVHVRKTNLRQRLQGPELGTCVIMNSRKKGMNKVVDILRHEQTRCQSSTV